MDRVLREGAPGRPDRRVVVYPSGDGPVERGLMRTNVRLVGCVVNIPQNALPLDVIVEMRTFLPPG